jgi:hypothetical protein
MSRCLLAVVSVLVTSAACAPAVLAQEGNGFYEPFPQPLAESKAREFASRLGVVATRDELASGLFVGRSLAPSPADRPAAPSRRAGVESSATAVGGLLLVALVALGLGALAASRVPVASRHA